LETIMATERGIVVRTAPGTAWVKTSRTSACEGCSEHGSCHMSEDGREMEVEAVDTVGAKVGDRILIGIETGKLLKVSFMLYIFPVLLMLAGAVVGQQAAPALGLNPDALAVAVGIGSFLVAFIIIRSRSRRMARTDCYRPRVIRILN
jgi:sigma-E factor negative regulatory protein RseC